MRQTSALARLAARIFRRAADALQKKEKTVFVIKADLRGWPDPETLDSMRPRSYFARIRPAMPGATRRRGPIRENKTRGNLKQFRRHGSNPPPPSDQVRPDPPPNPPKPTPPPNRIFREGDIEPLPAIHGSSEKTASPRLSVHAKKKKRGGPPRKRPMPKRRMIPGTMTAAEIHERCEHRDGVIQRCCLEPDHAGTHLFKCAGDYCPGLPWIASNTPHPTSCTMPPGDE